jgi:carboxyl-terminal processing protease
MTLSWFRNAAAAAALVAISSTACAQQADFNEVGRQMSIMLQNSHFAKLPFNADLGQRFLDEYLKDLDFQRLYFTRDDVEGFKAKYGAELHNMLLDRKCMGPATEIYRVFQTRVAERVALTEKLLADESFDFSTNETVMLSRKGAEWPRNEQEAVELWKLQIKEAVLGETMRRELLSKLSKEQGKPDPSASDRSPKEKVSLRYKRLLNSVNDVDEEEIANYFLSAVAGAHDPHTDYMSFRETNQFKDGMRNQLVGIGAQLKAEEDGATKITGIVIGGPADRAGVLKLNDRIVAVDTLNTGKPEDMTDIMFMKIDKVVDYIRGSEGTSVALKVEPAGGPPGEAKIVVIQRGKVEMKDELASGDVIEIKSESGTPHRLGVITLPSFYGDFDDGKVRCSVDVERILKRLIEEKIDGLALDLRNNGGGFLEEVRRMTGFFIDSGPVVQVKNTVGHVQVKDSDSGKAMYNGPMIVMIDKTSASASEILAGALQDFNRAVVVGDSSTFGKGTVQQPMDIGRMLPLFAARNRAGNLKLTIQKFYRPSGSSTQMEGVESNIVMPSLMDAMEVGESFLDHCLPHDRIRPAPDYKPLDAQALFIPKLKELSQARVNESMDYRYIIQDVIKAKERIKRNQLSLNKEVREKELEESNRQQKERNLERMNRFAKMAEEDRKNLTFYKVTLDDLDQNAPLKAYSPGGDSGDYMRRAKDAMEDLDETPKWPTGLDPLKRESLWILKDLVDLTESARLTGMLKGNAEIR